MNAPATIPVPAGLHLLRQPFPTHLVSKLPKESRKQIDERKNKVQGCMVWKCQVCGGAHHKDADHLDYVGHAALTDRLLDTDLEWSWEPVAFNAEGLPAFDRNGGLWIKLTVLGVTRLGYGSADGKTGGDAIKEIIGDALRNAAMRFGAALDLWHKGDLHADDEAPEGHSQDGAVSPREPTDYIPPEPIAGEVTSAEYAFPAGPAKNITQLKAMCRALWREIEGCGDDSELTPLLETKENRALIQQLGNLEHPEHRKIWEGDGADNPGISGLINRKKTEFAQAMADLVQAG